MSYLEVVDDHIIEGHLMKSAMMVVKHQIECILLYFLLEGHGGRHLHLSFFAEKIPIANAYAIEPHQISAIVGPQLLNIHHESLKFTEGNTFILIEQKRTAIDADLVHFISSFVLIHCIHLT